jgi:hypothetical protein
MSNRPEEVFEQYRQLEHVLIDASSIIYMQKAGFLDVLATTVELHAPRELILETGFEPPGIKPIEPGTKDLSNDQRLIHCAIESRWPVISEDKKILMRAKREGIPYFNALMMLNFLLFEKRLDLEAHSMHFGRLVQIAWYGSDVLEYGKSIYTEIVCRILRVT